MLAPEIFAKNLNFFFVRTHSQTLFIAIFCGFLFQNVFRDIIHIVFTSCISNSYVVVSAQIQL